MKYHHWHHIAIKINEPYQDLLVGQLALLGFIGFTQDKNVLNCVIPSPKWTGTIKNKFCVILEKFGHEFPSLDLSYSCSSLHEENWNKKWENRTGIVEATPNIIIKPTWKKLPSRMQNKLVLHIDPKMSFGTGHHETTRLSLILLEKFLKPKAKVLDFGTGTGILGIACVKLGARSVFAIDNDKWSIDNAKENIKKNHVQTRVKIKLGSVSAAPKLKFDLIVANIDFPTISKFIKSLSTKIKKQGVVIFSGILTVDIPVLLPLFQKYSLVPIELISENEWTSVSLRRI